MNVNPIIPKINSVAREALFFLSSVLAWVRRDFLWALLIVPVLHVVVVYFLSKMNYLGWGDRNLFKALMEIVHPVLLAGFLFVSLLRLWTSRDTAFVFLPDGGRGYINQKGVIWIER